MKIDDMTPTKSNFLTKEDVGEAGKNLTIGGFEQKEVGTESEKEMKYVIVWQQADYKPMVLNKENGNRIKMIAKTDDTDAMIGLTVNVYSDPFVSFGGKTVGGIRIRAAVAPHPQSRPAQNPSRAVTPPIRNSHVAAGAEQFDNETPPLSAYEDPNDEIPF